MVPDEPAGVAVLQRVVKTAKIQLKISELRLMKIISFCWHCHKCQTVSVTQGETSVLDTRKIS
jgi:hypothetical protein